MDRTARAARRILAAVLALLLVPLAALVARPAQAADPVRILVYGDSITQGSTGDHTWRYFLDRHLHDVGVPFDLVGPRDGLHPAVGAGGDDHQYAVPGFDTDHAAVWGQLLSAPAYDLGDLASTYRPDVVVALIGLNDLLWRGDSPAALAAVWRAQIARVRTANPVASVVLVQLPETWYAGVPAYNSMLADLAAELDAPSQRVVTTALPVFVKEVDTWDDTHPTASGDVKIAQAVGDALWKIGVALPPGMLPVVANGPRRAPTLSATPGVGEATLSWQDVPGATRVWLERRDASAGAAWERYPHPFEAGTVSFTAALVDGHRYELRLRPAKGAAISVDVTSPVVSVVPGARPPAPVLDPLRIDPGGRVQASWSASAGAASYVVGLRDATRGEPWRTVAATTGTSWTTTGLVGGHRYELSVQAVDGLIGGATSTAAGSVPLLAPVTRVRARSPRRDSVRTTAAVVPYATAYRLLVAPARRCRRPPRAAAFQVVGADSRQPAAVARTASGALWVRWYAVRSGVLGGLAGGSTVCTRVR